MPTKTRFETIDGTAFIETFYPSEAGSYYSYSFGVDSITSPVAWRIEDIDPRPDITNNKITFPVTARPGVGYYVQGFGARPASITSDLEDYISLNDVNSTEGISLKIGDDFVFLNNSIVPIIDGGAGEDFISLMEGSTAEAIFGSSENDYISVSGSTVTVIDGGDGENGIKLSDGSTAETIVSGSEKDEIRVSDSTVTVIDGGDGDDLFYLYYSSVGLLKAGNGNDRIYASGLGEFELGDGDDFFSDYDGDLESVKLTAGRGSDRISINALGRTKGQIDLTEDIQAQDELYFTTFYLSGSEFNAITIDGFSVGHDAFFISDDKREWESKWSYNGTDSFLTAISVADDSETAPLLIVKNADLREKKLSPFTLRADGVDFAEWDNTGDIYTASGTIIFGDERSGDLFQIQGSAKVDLQSETIQLTGIITTLTGSDKIKNQKILGASGLTIDVVTGTGFFEGDPIINLAGIEININDLAFLDAGYRFGFDIELLPEELGIDDPIDIKVGSGFLVTQNEIKLADATLDLPGPYRLFDVINVTTKDISISYDWPSDTLILQGVLQAEKLFGPLGPETVTLDLATDENLIQIKDGVADLIGFISVEEIQFKGVPWGIDKILLGINTKDKKLNGELVVRFPFQATIPPGDDISAGVSLEFLYEPTIQLNAIKLEVSTEDSTYVPIPLFPAAGITGIAGSVNNIATGDISFAGNLDLVFGTAKLIDAKFSGEVTEKQLQGTVAMTFSDKGLVSYTGSATLDWSKGLFNAAGVLRLLDGLVTANQDLKANSKLDVYSSLSTAISLPDSLTGIGYDIQLATGQAIFSFTNDDQLSNDYIKLLGSVGVVPGITLDLAYTRYFDGTSLFTTGKSLAGISGDVSIQQFNLLQQAKTQEDLGRYVVEPLSEWILLTSNWENASDAIPNFIIRRPDGSLIDSAEVLPAGFTVVEALSSQRSLAVLINSPEVGIWSLELTDPGSFGEVSYGGYTKDLPPTVAINNIVYRESDQFIDILYSASDPDSNPVVSLFYSSEQGVADGLLLASGLKTGDDQFYSWSTSGLPDGDYYFYAVIEDTINQPGYSYFASPVVIGSGGYLFDGVEPPPLDITGESVYRFFKKGTGSHLYTQQQERDILLGNPITDPITGSLVYEGPTFREIDDGVATQRFYNASSSTHINTIVPLEQQLLRQSPDWAYEGESYKVSRTFIPGVAEVEAYRFRNIQNGAFLYSVAPVEIDILNNNKSFINEGIAFFVGEF